MSTDTNVVVSDRPEPGTPFWFGPDALPQRGWLHEPAVANGVGIVIVPSFGYEELVGGWGVRMLADSLMHQGFRVLRYDHPGTGESAGQGPCISTWIGGVREAVTAVNTASVYLLGIRLGAAIALLAASDEQRVSERIERVIPIAPIASGRRLVKELMLLGAAASPPDTTGDVTADSGFASAGFEYSPSFREGLRSIDLTRQHWTDVAVSLVHSAERPTDAKLTKVLAGSVADLGEHTVSGLPDWLDRSSETSAPPIALVTALSAHIQKLRAGSSVPPQPVTIRTTAAVVLEEHTLHEHAAQLGTARLASTVVRTSSDPSAKVGVLLCNSGVERSLGPGRAWVDWARQWAQEGRVVARLDLSAVGNSGLHPQQGPLETYGRQPFDDLRTGLDLLAAEGCTRIAVVGLCSSAFPALGLEPDPRIVAVFAFNPQLYRCGTDASGPADAESTNVTKFRLARLDERFRLRQRAAHVLELLGRRHESIGWMRRLVDAGIRVELLFGENDRGLRFLRWRAPKGLQELARSPLFRLDIREGLDHAMHAAGPRNAAFQSTSERLRALD